MIVIRPLNVRQIAPCHTLAAPPPAHPVMLQRRLNDILLRFRSSRTPESPLLSSPSPEFTLRAVVLGLIIGCLLCFTNLYFGLQTGWISMMSLQSAIIGFLICKLLAVPITPQENVVVQTTAVATGTVHIFKCCDVDWLILSYIDASCCRFCWHYPRAELA
jgi:hypothetical protein